jgi:hypothetical protein
MLAAALPIKLKYRIAAAKTVILKCFVGFPLLNSDIIQE